ncbi:MAG: glycosyltransferase family 4 protein [Candidatus Magasanikbacteria bacterium CG10_big_fil_rev_8_21_14_0_10_42_10]|uniref:Glycosyltransferase family 4 protein n=2 Tax=Candidatus Magasanikiibacteriota TaxID=1752731 RepID=A0A2H0TWL0_9BACT|nr:MAG: glycosyltransferase family 4 protein [Candidatus Magasanikbacteria bacterium CG10_big_fil_rev_8_21_14_0_10_42_10]PIZ92681.1 MAG: glycosyltransferase family 4 protein [Candidatus Magasanikbacteria bacterium CG_4_10_14_0_2_um_filter_41_10]
MNILIASDTYYPNLNGASYFTYRLATLLAKRGHHVSVICPSQTYQKTTYIQDGVHVYGVPSMSVLMYKGFRFSPLTISKKAISESLSKIQPEVMHIQNHFFIGRAVSEYATKHHIPIMGTNHFMPENLVHYLHFPPKIEAYINRIAWKQCFKVFKHLNIVTTPTHTAAALLKKVGFPKEVKVLSCGLDLKRFKPTHPDIARSIKQTYHIPLERKVLLYTGRLDREKRIDIVLHAMPIILKTCDAHLVIAGEGKQHHTLETLAHTLGIQDRVTFTGFVPDNIFQDIYHVADVFVNAGIAELQSIVTMEALASGLPVVAANAMALPELVHDGKNGFLFPVDDIDALATHVIRIFSDSTLQAQMSQESLRIIQKHDIQNVIQVYESLYEQTIANTKSTT